MNKILLLILVSVLCGCNSGDKSTSYSTVIGDITIVGDGSNATTNKTNTADVKVSEQDK